MVELNHGQLDTSLRATDMPNSTGHTGVVIGMSLHYTLRFWVWPSYWNDDVHAQINILHSLPCKSIDLHTDNH